MVLQWKMEENMTQSNLENPETVTVVHAVLINCV